LSKGSERFANENISFDFSIVVIIGFENDNNDLMMEGNLKKRENCLCLFV